MVDVKDKIKRVHAGNNLETLRRKAGLSQERLAKELISANLVEQNKMSQSRISDLELKEVIPAEVLQPFAEFYGVSVRFIQEFNIADAEKAMMNNTLNITHAENTNGNDSYVKTYEAENDYNDNSIHTVNYTPIEKVTELYERMIEMIKENYEAEISRLKEELGENKKNNIITCRPHP